MFKFFDGGRRKIGCIALLAACAFTAGWVRSSYTADYLALVIGRNRIAILSQQGTLSSGLFSQNSNEQRPDAQSAKDQSTESKSGWWTVKLPAKDLNFSHYPTALPYWSFIFALLLLSAWMLLVKPPVSIPQLPASTGTPTSWTKRPNRKAKRSR